MTTADELLCGAQPHREGFTVAGSVPAKYALLDVLFVELIGWCSGVV